MDRYGLVTFLGSDWNRVGECIREVLHSDICLLETVNANILAHSGKMLRPMMALLVARACGEVNGDSIRFAATSEILHNATLMHDDVADESRERRGAPTVFALMGASSAVLVGDYWLARSMELVMEAHLNKEKVMSLFARTLSDLAEGEMLQLQKADTADTDEEDYFRIIYNKTASLFVAACESAAISVGASPEYVSAVRDYARYAGIAFQIKDDILDYVGTGELGKPVGIDLKEQKITLPLLGALKGSGLETEIRRMVRDIHSLPDSCETVRRFVLDHGGVEYASGVLDSFIEKAERALDVLPDSDAKKHLVMMARYNAYRRV